MNWTDIAVIAILLSSMYFGWKKGFIVAAIEFIKWIASIIIARLFYVKFTDTLLSIFGNPTDKIKEHVRNYLFEMLKFETSTPQPLGPVEMNSAIETLKLPMDFEEKIRMGLAEKMINSTTGFVDEATVHMSDMILYGLGFLLLILILLSLFSFAQVIGKVVSKLPLIKQLNNGGGLILGSVIGVVSVYFIMAMLTYLRTFDWARDTLVAIESSQFAIYFYKYNILQYVFNHILLKGQFN